MFFGGFLTKNALKSDLDDSFLSEAGNFLSNSF